MAGLETPAQAVSQNSSAADKEWEAQVDAIPTDPQPDKTKKRPTRRSVKEQLSSIDNKKRPAGQTARKDLTEDLLAMFGSMAMPLFMFGANNPKLAYDAYIIMAKSEELAKALNALAQRNPAVHRVLFAMMNVSDGAMLLTAIGNLAVPIAANHGLLPPQAATLFNAPDPTTFNPLEAMMEQKVQPT